MRRALRLAERGRGRVEPNPMVGAVVVQAGRVAGEGFHERFGAPHAEPNAIAEAGAACRGATLYVTLEPCTHQGKTPPCVPAVIAAGFARVVAAMIDPDPRNQGRGLEQLRQAGIAVEAGLLEREAQRLNAPFAKLTTRGLPFVTAKWAMSLDGKSATRTGESRWISSEASREVVHTLRGQADAILVGVGTALADDPLLTARPPGPRTAVRIVADSRARLPLGSRLVRSISEAPLLVATTEAAPAERRAALAAAGAEVLALPAERGRVPLQALMAELGRRRMTNVLLEGGGELCAAALAGGLVDRVLAFVAPLLIGGRDAPTPVGGEGIAAIAQAIRAREWSLSQLGGDALIEARL
ncbi:MAG: bifunctional diaminohydroxyphosphoribosylaminopyrimidine deaminase/5-amino-6-(5-phosphoribosylamino)uracil reductase RibD [Planctomycetes bacterium]|nr:bifunctional diaminohydroxyphosphoribosylaminopyrimidine deaminase/5-amino-6-(5-phosphoribosylamino)uracil reductase RibD [Planctomycetota bacterium]